MLLTAGLAYYAFAASLIASSPARRHPGPDESPVSRLINPTPIYCHLSAIRSLTRNGNDLPSDLQHKLIEISDPDDQSSLLRCMNSDLFAALDLPHNLAELARNVFLSPKTEVVI